MENVIWLGENKNKGLAIIPQKNHKIIENDWDKYCL